MKKIIVLALTCMMAVPGFAQKKLSEAKQNEIIQKVDKAASKMESMQCEFTQTKSMKMMAKKMESKGTLTFKRPDKLRWEYTAPYTYIFAMNGNKVTMKSSKSTQNIDVNQNKMFRQITGIILNCITGEGMKSSSDFRIEMYEQNGEYYALLYPKKKELKQIYKTVELHFNPEMTLVTQVKMEEKSGDVTLIQMSGAKVNTAIDEKIFTVK